jgi:hypothetical protein
MQHKATAIESQNLYDLSLALIFALALLLRLAPGGRYVTPDEPAWVQRSIHFRQALAAGDLSALPATGHPGVTTMWLGSLGVQIHCWLDPDTAAAHLNWLDGLAGLSPQNAAAFGPLAFFLPAGRVLVAVVTSLGVAGAFALSARLWGRKTAWLAALLLALDPFLIGHSGLLHVDGLLAPSAPPNPPLIAGPPCQVCWPVWPRSPRRPAACWRLLPASCSCPPRSRVASRGIRPSSP